MTSRGVLRDCKFARIGRIWQETCTWFIHGRPLRGRRIENACGESPPPIAFGDFWLIRRSGLWACWLLVRGLGHNMIDLVAFNLSFSGFLFFELLGVDVPPCYAQNPSRILSCLFHLSETVDFEPILVPFCVDVAQFFWLEFFYWFYCHYSLRTTNFTKKDSIIKY